MAPRGSFVDLVFRLVIFHQSLIGHKNYPPMVGLTEEERFLYCDPKLFKYMVILMISDSSSYTFIFR